MQIKNIRIKRIKVKKGRRSINPEKVNEIANSISILGLLHPISINKQYHLIAGHHRLQAYKKLGKKTIPSIITEKGLKADLAEIDENLIRQELSVLERGEHLKKRKELYEILYPTPFKGGPGRGHREKQRTAFVPFTLDSAKKTGSSRRYIEQAVQIANNLSSDIKKMIRNTELANNKVELLQLARLDKKLQHKVVKARLKNDTTSVDEIVRDVLIKQRILQRERARKKLLHSADSAVLPGDIMLYHGDCREVFPEVIESLRNESPEAEFIVIFDPPYNIQFAGYENYSDTLPEEEYIAMMRVFAGMPSAIIQYPEEMMSLIYPALGKPEEVLCWCYNSNLNKAFRLINIYNAKPDFTQCRQPYKNPTDRRVQKRIQQGSSGASLYDWFSDIQLEKNVSKTKYHHPCQVPVALMERLILLLTQDSTVVIDPFMGVGTTGLACKRLQRRFIGIEISKEYYKLAKSRLSVGK